MIELRKLKTRDVKGAILIVMCVCFLPNYPAKADDSLSGEELLRAVRERDRGATRPPRETRTMPPKVNNGHPAISDLVDRFAQNHNKLRSFIVKCDAQSEGVVDLPPKVQEELSTRSASEYRFDGDRICSRFNATVHGVPGYNSHLWDGNSWYDQSRPKGKPGQVIITARRDPIRDKARLSREKEISPWLGYLYGADERIDTILREAIKRGESVSVQEERIRGSKCSVITAMTKLGKYTVWLDAEKDYHVVKAIVEKRPGDLAYDGPPLTEGDYCYYSVDYVQYKKQGDTWVPQKGQCEMKGKTSGGHFEYVAKYNFGEVILNPDHEALRSFVPDDIMNGAKVRIKRPDSNEYQKGEYTWQNGQIVDAEGRKVSLDPNNPQS